MQPQPSTASIATADYDMIEALMTAMINMLERTAHRDEVVDSFSYHRWVLFLYISTDLHSTAQPGNHVYIHSSDRPILSLISSTQRRRTRKLHSETAQ